MIGMLTGAAPDCGPPPLAPGWSVMVKLSGRGDWQGGATAVRQNVIFGVMSEVQKDSEDISVIYVTCYIRILCRI
jgi:hypothetical protein